MTDTTHSNAPAAGYEHDRAIMEAERNASADAVCAAYGFCFDAEGRRRYEAGYTNGWRRALECATPAPVSAGAQEPALYLGKMDFEALQTRGRCTLTAYSTPVGDSSNEVALYTAPQPQAVQAPCAWARAQWITNDAGFTIGTDDPEVVWGEERPEDDSGESPWLPLYGEPVAQAVQAQAADEPQDEDEESAEDGWRRLALQFDGHRMQALHWLKLLVPELPDSPEKARVRAFLSMGPLDGEEVLARRIAALSAPALQAGAGDQSHSKLDLSDVPVAHPSPSLGRPSPERYRQLIADTLDDDFNVGTAYAPCTVPPAGWSCTRGAGHDGPCAAVQVGAGERETFEAAFAVPDGVKWNGTKYVVSDDYLNSYRCDRFIGQWEAWQKARAARGAAAVPAGSEGDPLRRAEFEHFMEKVRKRGVARATDGHYLNTEVNGCWHVWHEAMTGRYSGVVPASRSALAYAIEREAEHWAYMAQIDNGDAANLAKLRLGDLVAALAASPAAPVAAAVQAPAAGQQAGGSRVPAATGLRVSNIADSIEAFLRLNPPGDALAYLREVVSMLSGATPAPEAEQAAPAAVRVPSDTTERDAAFEAVRKRLCALQRYSFVLDDDGVVRRVEDRTGNWIEFDAAHELFDPVAVDAALAAPQANQADASPVCTCPTGDGSLRWPCPVHPPADAAREGGETAPAPKEKDHA